MSPPVLRGAETDPARDTASAGIAPRPIAPPPSEPVEPRATCLVRGRLLGLDPGDTELARVAIRALRTDHTPSTPLASTAAADGTVEVDVTSLFVTTSRVLGLEVEVAHPRYMRAVAQTPVTPDPENLSGPRVFSVEIRMVRAGAAFGTVVGPGGAPVEGAAVGMFRVEASQVGADPIERQQTGRDGRWRLRAGLPGRYLVAAIAQGLQPAAREVALAPGEEIDVGRLELPAGVTVAGRVSLRGAPVPGGRVQIQHREDGTELHLSPDVLWTERGVLAGEAQAEIDELGHYSLRGLSPGMALARVASIRAHPIHMALSEQTERPVEIPASGLDFDVDGVDLVVEVRAAGRALPDALIGVIVEGFVSGQTDAEGRFTIMMPHGSRGRVSVEVAGYEPVTRDVQLPETGASHREEITLEPRRPRPAVVLRLVAPEGRTVRSAGVGLFPAEGGDAWPLDNHDLEGKENRFRFEAPAGRALVRVRPGGPWHGGTAHWLEADVLVDVPSLGDLEVEIPIREGGRLRVVARRPDGSPLSVPCTVRRANGLEVPVVFVARGPSGMTAGSKRTHGEITNDVDPVLEPGIYSVSFEGAGYSKRTVGVRVEAGRTADVDVTLEARR